MPAEAGPYVSVIIPTHNRSASLRRLLDALCRQTRPAQEVVVVADGCTDGTSSMVQAYAAPYRLRCIESPGRGAAAARNAGAAAAGGHVLLFLDDDVEPMPQLVEAHIQAHQGQADVVSLGYLPPAFPAPADFLQILQRRWWEDTFQAMRQPGHRFTFRDLMSGNFSLEARLFKRVGGFDARLACREDYELGVRLLEAGAFFTLVPEAVAYHHDRTDLKRALERVRQEGRGDVMIGRRHPALRATLALYRMHAVRTLRARIPLALAFRWPQAGAFYARLLRLMLPVFERIRLRGRWVRYNERIRTYWYWRGVADELGTGDDLRAFVQNAPPLDEEPGRELVLDLKAGVERAARRLDVERPAGVLLRYGCRSVGRIPPVPGAERLRGRHLRPLLARDFAWPLLVAKTLEKATEAASDADRASPGPPAHPARAALQAETQKGEGSVKLVDLELTRQIQAAYEVEPFHEIRFLVRYRGRPIGWACLGREGRPAVTWEQVEEAVAAQHGWNLVQEVLGEVVVPKAEPRVPLRPFSVVVCTRDRTALLERCLTALLALDYPDYEVIVVDNAPMDDRTEALVRDLPVRYVCEGRPGLDRARNRGVAEARHDLIAFTDDDTQADRLWLHALAQAFADPDVTVVTGLVAPAALETPAQRYFEDVYGGMGKGFRRKYYHAEQMSTRDRLWASGFGVGANMAVRRSTFSRVGLFDEALDVGTPSRGGGDVEFFHRVVAQGLMLCYEPQALVWHQHRREPDALRRQLHDNGRSFGAYLLTCVRNGTVSRGAALGFAWREWLLGWLLRRMWRPGGHARRLVLVELAGLLQSPLAYRAARKQARRVARDAARTSTPVVPEIAEQPTQR